MADPASWAVVGSVGLHGIILALLPFMSLPSPQETEPEIENRVPVVELGEEQLSRVPDFSGMEAPFPEDFSSSEVESYSLEDFLDLPTTNLPEPSNRPDPLPSQLRVQRQPFEWPAWPTPPSSTRSRSSIRLPSNPPPTQRREESTTATPPANTEETDTETADSTAEQDAQESTNTEQTETEQTETEQTDENSEEVATNDTGEPSSEDSESQTPQERLLAEQQQLQQQFTSRQPTKEEYDTARNQWLSAAQQESLEVIPYPQVIQGPPSLISCVEGESVKAYVGIFVSAEGAVLETPPPIITAPSNYERLDAEAIAFAEQLSFEPSEEKRAYSLEIEFPHVPEICSSVPTNSVGAVDDQVEDGTVSQQGTPQGEVNSSGTGSSNATDESPNRNS